MSGNTFPYDRRDLEFVLKEWLDSDKLFSLPAYRDSYSSDDIDSILDTAYKICRNELAPLDGDSDKTGVRFVDGKVITPESFKRAFKVINEAGMGASQADREGEGRIPCTLVQANFEMFCVASTAFTSYWGLSAGAISVIQQYGSEYLKRKFLPKMLSGRWGGTMNLTEPGAGSDVGASLTRAFATEEAGVYKIRGNKIFITTGDHDLCENIIHLVLARIEGAREGVAGLSLFIVPGYWVDDEGAVGESNDVLTMGIEHKMGLHGSPTCSLAYGENEGCRGYLIGEPRDDRGNAYGMQQMFLMMNEERLNVGVQGVAACAKAYNLSLDYAKNRVQGAGFSDPAGPKVRIIEHEDVRRMLMLQKAYTEAIRALILKTAYYLDLSRDSDDAAEREFAEEMFQVSNPMCKAFATDIAWPMVAEAIQIFGGYGFIAEYRVEQIARDCKILSIWEGTNYIQAMDLVRRKFAMKKGGAFRRWLKEISDFIEKNKETKGFEREFELLRKAFSDFVSIMERLDGFAKSGQSRMTPLFCTRILHACSTLYCGRLLLDQALLASGKFERTGENMSDAKFYKGKIASARFFMGNILQGVGAVLRQIEIGDTSALEIDEECF